MSAAYGFCTKTPNFSVFSVSPDSKLSPNQPIWIYVLTLTLFLAIWPLVVSTFNLQVVNMTKGTAGALDWNYTFLCTFWLQVCILCWNPASYVLRGFCFACVALFSSSEPLLWWIFGFSQVLWCVHEYFGDWRSSGAWQSWGAAWPHIPGVIFGFSKTHSFYCLSGNPIEFKGKEPKIPKLCSAALCNSSHLELFKVIVQIYYQVFFHYSLFWPSGLGRAERPLCTAFSQCCPGNTFILQTIEAMHPIFLYCLL